MEKPKKPRKKKLKDSEVTDLHWLMLEILKELVVGEEIMRVEKLIAKANAA